MIRRNLKAVIMSPVFWFCVLISFLIMLMGDIGLWTEPAKADGRQAFSIMDHFVESWFMFSYILTVLPVLTSVPAGFGFYDEKKNGIMLQKILRQGSMKYCVKMTIQAALSGFLVILFSEILFAVFMIVMPAGSVYFEDGTGMYSNTTGIFSSMMSDGKGIWVFLLTNLACSVYGMIWPVFGLAAAAWGRSRCMAVVVPFMLWCLLDHLTNIVGWFHPVDHWCLWSLDISNITLLFNLQHQGVAGVLYAYVYALLCIFIGFLVFSLGIRRIRKQGVIC